LPKGVIMSVSPLRVAERLGGASTLGQYVRTATELRNVVEAGLPVASLDAVTGHLGRDAAEATVLKYRVVPKTTLRRRTRLSFEESERTERLARMTALAEQVWEGEELAREFLTSPQPQLGNERPIDLARSELGAREVEALLMRLEYALPA
jgi:putative toxin-antitoxin system antitoxin component (TIGR02293 family)